MIVITGWRSRVSEEFRALLPDGEKAEWAHAEEVGFPLVADRYFFCSGLIRPKQRNDQTQHEVDEGWRVNFTDIKTRCDAILAENKTARICIVGSESAYLGSFDGVYATAKRALHRYVEKKEIRPHQQLVVVSPGIIEDAGMTTRRTDVDNLERKRKAHPKGRFLTSAEVARMAHFLLYVDRGYTSGTVVRMNGGLN